MGDKLMKRYLYSLLLLLFILIPTGVVLADPAADRVVDDGDSIPGDVTIFDDGLEVKEGGEIEGDVVVWNGDASVAGTIRGDLVVMNGNLVLADTAVIRGECVVMNGELTGASESGINCTNLNGIFENLPPFVNNLISGIPDEVLTDSTPAVETGSYFWLNLLEVFGQTVLLGVLSFVAALLLPQHMQRIKHTVHQKPVASGVVGILTVLAVPSLAFVLLLVSVILIFVCIGILGFPIIFALFVGLFLGTMLGWFTIGNLVGEFVTSKLHLHTLNQPATTATGTMMLTLLFGLLGLIPFIYGEAVVGVLAMCVGLGGVALTKFGTRDYPLQVLVEPDVDKVTAVLETLHIDESETDAFDD